MWLLATALHSCFWHNALYIDGLVQEKSNAIANALELRGSYTNLSIYQTDGPSGSVE